MAEPGKPPSLLSAAARPPFSLRHPRPRGAPPSPSHPSCWSRGLPASRLKLPTHARPASCRARSSRVPSPRRARSPRARKEPRGWRPDHAPAGRHSRPRGPAGRAADGGQGSTASRMSARPAGPEDARSAAAGLRSPLTPPCARPSAGPRRLAPGLCPRRPARPATPGHPPPPRPSAGPSSRPSLPATSRPARRPFLTGRAYGLAGRRSRLERRPPRRPGPAGQRPRGSGAWASVGGGGAAVKQQSREEGRGGRGRTRRKGKAPAAGSDAPRSPAERLQQSIHYQTPNNCEGQRKRQVSSDRLPRGPRARAHSCRLSAPGRRHDAERASATVSVVAAAAAAATEVAVASAPRRKRLCSLLPHRARGRAGGHAHAELEPAGWLACARSRRGYVWSLGCEAGGEAEADWFCELGPESRRARAVLGAPVTLRAEAAGLYWRPRWAVIRAWGCPVSGPGVSPGSGSLQARSPRVWTLRSLRTVA